MVPAPARSWARATIEYVYPHEYGYMAVNAACATIRSLPRRLLAVAHCTPRLYALMRRSVAPLGLTRGRGAWAAAAVCPGPLFRSCVGCCSIVTRRPDSVTVSAPRGARARPPTSYCRYSSEHSSRYAAWRARGRAIEDLALDHSD